jgi:hypothetical protein
MSEVLNSAGTAMQLGFKVRNEKLSPPPRVIFQTLMKNVRI